MYRIATYFWVFVFVMGFAGLAFAQSSEPPAVRGGTTTMARGDIQPYLSPIAFSLPKIDDPAKRPPLWRLDTGTNTIHFFGSVHFLARRFRYPEVVENAYRVSDVLAIETNFDSIDVAAEEAFFQDMAVMNPGWKLYDVIHPDVYEKIQVKAATFGFDMRVINGLAPWYVAFAIGGLSLDGLNEEPLFGHYGVDRHFVRLAYRDGKPIVTLEKSPERYNVWADLPLDLQEEFLEETMAPPYRAKQVLQDFVAAWEVGDLDAMVAAQKQDYFSDQTSRYKKVEYQRLLVDRNKSWVDVIEREFINSGQNYMVIGGAYHFTGPDSVIKLLQARGHKVERVEY